MEWSINGRTFPRPHNCLLNCHLRPFLPYLPSTKLLIALEFGMIQNTVCSKMQTWDTWSRLGHWWRGKWPLAKMSIKLLPIHNLGHYLLAQILTGSLIISMERGHLIIREGRVYRFISYKAIWSVSVSGLYHNWASLRGLWKHIKCFPVNYRRFSDF